MELALSPEDAAFRDEVRAFIAGNYPADNNGMGITDRSSATTSSGFDHRPLLQADSSINIQFGDPAYHVLRYAQLDAAA
jgi:hypothetical protein